MDYPKIPAIVSHDTVHVNAVFEEAELFVESELADNVEGMVLELGLVAVSAYNGILSKTETSVLTPRSKPLPAVANSSSRFVSRPEQESLASSISSNELIL